MYGATVAADVWFPATPLFVLGRFPAPLTVCGERRKKLSVPLVAAGGDAPNDGLLRKGVYDDADPDAAGVAFTSARDGDAWTTRWALPAAGGWGANILLSRDPNNDANGAGCALDVWEERPQDRSGGSKSNRHCGHTCC